MYLVLLGSSFTAYRLQGTCTVMFGISVERTLPTLSSFSHGLPSKRSTLKQESLFSVGGISYLVLLGLSFTTYRLQGICTVMFGISVERTLRTLSSFPHGLLSKRSTLKQESLVSVGGISYLVLLGSSFTTYRLQGTCTFVQQLCLVYLLNKRFDCIWR